MAPSALIDDLRDLYPDKPVVLTSGGAMLDWVQTEGPHQVTPVSGASSTTALAGWTQRQLRIANESL